MAALEGTLLIISKHGYGCTGRYICYHIKTWIWLHWKVHYLSYQNTWIWLHWKVHLLSYQNMDMAALEGTFVSISYQNMDMAALEGTFVIISKHGYGCTGRYICYHIKTWIWLHWKVHLLSYQNMDIKTWCGCTGRYICYHIKTLIWLHWKVHFI